MKNKKDGVTSISLIGFLCTAWFAADALNKGSYNAVFEIVAFTFLFFLIKPKGL